MFATWNFDIEVTKERGGGEGGGGGNSRDPTIRPYWK